MSDTLDAAPAPAADPPAARGIRAGLRPLLVRLHFHVGLFVGPFILVAAVTGLIYTITPQLDQLLYRDALTVPAATTAVDLRTQVAAAAAAVPDGTLTSIRPAATPTATTRVGFDSPGVAEDDARTAFVDPHTGQVRAVLDTFGEWLPTRAWIDTLHRNLHLGEVGRVYSELAASWLWVLAVSGLVLWVVRRRRRSRLRRTLLPEASARGRARVRSWHGSVGLWAAIGMLGLSATGLTWSQFAGTNVSALRTALDWTTPSVSAELPAASVPAPTGEAAERVLAAARAAGMTDPVAITPPEEAGQAWTVAQVQRSWPLKQDSMAVDPSSGTVLETIRYADWPVAAKLAEIGISAHMGILFGVANQLLLIALALGIIVVVVWGYRMWWLRRPTRSGATAPGGTERPGVAAVAVVGLAAVVLGVFLPVLGASLLLFLLGDALWQEYRRSRAS
ncbi:PepSY-associated TM helix domain-containing protein [Actinomycetospora corticicola]|uniref:Putative iron-regulated membrane protein n=1 Tax=Actinomycetospora corticicola TaxID=663602 RepID=A0A7Y9DVG6_9PSEU|nr:putative iron-regulated membrane protein [Actinomycetospora corticicola]